MNVLILDGDDLNERAARIFVESADESVSARGRFAVALSGGETPEPVYYLLAGELARAVRWDKTQVFFSDERCVPPEHPDSNFSMADELLLAKVPIPPGNIHRMRGEIAPDAAAFDYAREIAGCFGLMHDEVPHFDLILLGMGEDGHTASLFPGSEAVHETLRLVSAPFVPKMNANRLTLTPPVLRHARRILLLVKGSSRAGALKQVLEGPYEPDRWPAQVLRESEGQVTWLVDRAAASLLDGNRAARRSSPQGASHLYGDFC